jgi:hypothetical protein
MFDLSSTYISTVNALLHKDGEAPVLNLYDFSHRIAEMNAKDKFCMNFHIDSTEIMQNEKFCMNFHIEICLQSCSRSCGKCEMIFMLKL